MKTNLLKKSIFLFVFSILLASCDDVKEMLTISVPINPPAVDLKLTNEGFINPTSQVQRIVAADEDEVVLAEKRFSMGVVKAIEARDASIENLKKIIFNSAELLVIEPKDYDLNTLKGLKFYFDEELVAEVSGADNENRKVLLDIKKDDILEYAKKESILVRVTGKEKLTVPSVNAKLILKFTAKVGMK